MRLSFQVFLFQGIMETVTVMSSMNAVGVQVLHAGTTCSAANASRCSTVRLGSGARLGGMRLNITHSATTTTISNKRATVIVVRAEEGITDRVQNAVGDAANKVKDTAGAAKGKVEDAAGRVGDFVSGKAEEAQDAAGDVSRDVQNKAEKAGNKAADAGRDLEGSAKNASRDARGEADNLAVSSSCLSFLCLHCKMNASALRQGASVDHVVYFPCSATFACPNFSQFLFSVIPNKGCA